MADPKKIQKYRDLALKLLAEDVDSAKSLLLALLRDYADTPSGDDGLINRAGLFLRNLVHKRNYRDFVRAKIVELEDEEAAPPLVEFTAEIDTVISDDQLRLANSIPRPHDINSDFHALWIGFFIYYPEAFQLNPADSILKSCHSEAIQIVRNETYNINTIQPELIIFLSRYLSADDLLAFALACKRIYSATLEKPHKQAKLLRLLANQEYLAAQNLLTTNASLNLNSPYNRERDPIVIACLDRQKAAYDMLIAPYLRKFLEEDVEIDREELLTSTKFPKEEWARKTLLLEFHYLVISGQRIKAEKFLAKYDKATKEYLIFEKGIELNAVELSELEQSDIEMRRRFKRQLCDNPDQLIQLEREQYQKHPKKADEQKNWNHCYDVLMEQLDAANPSYRARIGEHISHIRNNPALANPAKAFLALFMQQYQKVISFYSARQWEAGNQAWLDLGKLMRKLARHRLWEYFRPGKFFSLDDRATILRTGFEAEPEILDAACEELAFTLSVGEDLFGRLYADLGKTHSLFRGWLGRRAACVRLDRSGWGDQPADIAAEFDAVSHIFAANEQKVNKESESLQLTSVPGLHN